MANRVTEKSHSRALGYVGAPFANDFGVVTPLANAVNTTVVTGGFLSLPIACKIPLITLGFSGVSGITAFNIVIGGAAEAGVLVADNSDVGVTPPTLNTTPGLSLFMAGTYPNFTGPSDQVVAASTAYSGQTFQTSEPDAIFPQNTVLTLRFVTGGAVAGTVFATLLCIPVDIYQNYAGLWTWGPTNVG